MTRSRLQGRMSRLISLARHNDRFTLYALTMPLLFAYGWSTVSFTHTVFLRMVTGAKAEALADCILVYPNLSPSAFLGYFIGYLSMKTLDQKQRPL